MRVETDPKTARVWDIVEPITVDAGLELVDIEHRREGRGTVLRLLIDKQGGISLDELTRVSREVSDVLDAHPEAVAGAYTLEVSSPGINRPLTRPAHFTAFVGKRVQVRTRRPIGVRHSFRGVLTSVDSDGIVITSDDAQTHAITFDAIARANYQHEFASASHGRAHPRRAERRAGRKSGAR
jgi:ribosome maturation factor RimP